MHNQQDLSLREKDIADIRKEMADIRGAVNDKKKELDELQDRLNKETVTLYKEKHKYEHQRNSFFGRLKQLSFFSSSHKADPDPKMIQFTSDIIDNCSEHLKIRIMRDQLKLSEDRLDNGEARLTAIKAEIVSQSALIEESKRDESYLLSS
ncbi:MAG: hypothetical protein A3F46_04660 [Legionellales bacterium RIFCSPHIGHO2_12_FULL_42_9]|nr:MAG: hypothetical protein A3F46_04660 [Legionellales bacterium RIFCSPHIGHO2_12_FULL_42_9]